MIERSFFESYYIELVIAAVVFCFFNIIFFVGIWRGRITQKTNFNTLTITFNSVFFVSMIIAYILLRPQTIETRIAFLPTDIQVENIDTNYKFGTINEY